MNSEFNLLSHIDLQLFAEGGSAGASGASAGTDGASSNGSDNVNTGEGMSAAGTEAAEGAAQVEDRASLYAKFRNDFKAEHDAEIQKIVRGRLKNANEFVNKTKPLFETLATKYGVSADDVDSILKAVESDDSYYSEKALEAGMTVEDFREREKLQREVERYRAEERRIRENAERNEANKRFNAQVESVKKVYPGFDIKTESNNPNFTRLVSRGVDLKTAYEVVHNDEIITSAMQAAVQKSADKLSASVASNISRPNENGMGSQSSAVSTVDVSNLSKEQMADLKKRAARGEKITFRDKQF